MPRDQGSNADLALAGFATMQGRMDAQAERDRAETARKRPLHPAIQGALDRIIRGEMSGADAADWAHQNMGDPQGGQPLPSPYGTPLEPNAQTPVSVGVPVGPNNSPPPMGQRPPPSYNQAVPQAPASIGSYAQARPSQAPNYTAQDLSDADALSQARQRSRPASGLSFEQQKELEGIKQGGRVDLQSMRGEQGAATQASREQMYMDASRRRESGEKIKLQEKANLTHYEEEQKLQRLLLSLQNRLATAEQRGADNKEVAAIMAQLGEARTSAQIMSSLASIVDDNLAHEQRGKYNAMLDQVEQGVSNLRAGQGVPNPKGAPAPQPGAANRPAAVQTKKTQTQTIHPNAPARIRVQGPDGETGTMDPAELPQHPGWKAI